jgi:CBS domain containing-hemolysin-like protein
VTPIVAVVVILCLVVVSAVAHWVEVTFTRLGRARARGLDEAFPHRRGTLLALVADRERALGPVSLVRLAAQMGIGAIVAVVVADSWGGWPAVGAFVLVALLTEVLAGAVPRRLGLEANDRSALTTRRLAATVARAWPLRVLAAPLSRLAAVLVPHPHQMEPSDIGEDELIALAEAAAEADVIETLEAGLIESIIALGDTVVREVMVPRPDMVVIPADLTVDEALAKVVESGYTRLPVHGEGGVDDVVGVVISKDLLKAQLAGCGDRMVVALARDAWFVPETKRAAELMREMQARKVHLAITIDEYGATAGLVTLEDIIEELVGEIIDEYDEDRPLVEERADGSLLVSGRLPVDEFAELISVEPPTGGWDTVGGLLFDLLGHVPVEGETAVWDGHRLRAERVDGRRIELVAVHPVEEPNG